MYQKGNSVSCYLNIFFISSPQEALAVRRVRKDFQVDICYAVRYQGCTEGLYSNVIQSILYNQDIEFLDLSLRNHRIEVNSVRLIRAVKAIIWNLRSIRRVNSHIRETIGCSVKGHRPVVRFFAQKDSPIFDLMRYQGDIECINIDHCPSDAESREPLGGKHVQVRGSEVSRKMHYILFRDGVTIRNVLKVCRWSARGLCRYFFVKAVRTVYSDFCRKDIAGRGYSWIPAEAYSILDYKDLQVLVRLKDDGRLVANGSCILLVEHISQYTNIYDLHEELGNKDMVSIYAQMCRDHCLTNELILLKLHPAVEEFASRSSIRLYTDSIISRLVEIGYNKVYLINEYIDDDLQSLYPIECLKECLNIKKVVGVYSSVMVNMSHYKDVKVISDCREISFFRDLRDRESRFMDFRFEAY